MKQNAEPKLKEKEINLKSDKEIRKMGKTNKKRKTWSLNKI